MNSDYLHGVDLGTTISLPFSQCADGESNEIVYYKKKTVTAWK